MISLFEHSTYPYVGCLTRVSSLNNWRDVQQITHVDRVTQMVRFKRLGSFSEDRTIYTPSTRSDDGDNGDYRVFSFFVPLPSRYEDLVTNK